MSTGNISEYVFLVNMWITYFAPLQAPVVIDWSVNAECDASEPPEGADDGGDKYPKRDPLGPLR